MLGRGCCIRLKINLYCWDKDSRGDKEMIDFADKGVYIVQLFSVLQAKNKKNALHL